MTKKPEVEVKPEVAKSVATYRVFNARFDLVAQTIDKEEAEKLAVEFNGSYKINS